MKFGGFFIALAFVLSACSSDPAPREPEPTSTAQPSSTATPPTMPAQASEDSPEGAAAFVNYWVQVSNYAAATGDVAELSRISSPDCTGCQKYIDLYRDTYKAGGYFKGGDWKIGKLEVQPIDGTYVLTTPMRANQSTYTTSSDSNEFIDPAQQTVLSFATAFDSTWAVTRLGLGDVQ